MATLIGQDSLGVFLAVSEDVYLGGKVGDLLLATPTTYDPIVLGVVTFVMWIGWFFSENYGGGVWLPAQQVASIPLPPTVLLLLPAILLLKRKKYERR